MKTKTWTFIGNGRLAGVMAAVLLAPLASAQTTQRPISDFLKEQGTFCIPDRSGGCSLFVPPVPNFVGWGDQAGNLGASVDYAGLANACFGNAFGTTMSGGITERTLADGRAEDTVLLFTQNALTWVVGPVNGMIDFVNGPVVFGHRWNTNSPVCTLNGASPTLGTSFLHLKFINIAPGAPLPDFLQLFFFPVPGQQQMIEYSFQVNATGPLANGAPGMVTVVQTGNAVRSNIQAAVINLRATGK